MRQLQGRIDEIHGQVKEYDGRAEIILEEYRQLSGSTARIPPLPKNYDVENKGRYSAGTSPKKPESHLRRRGKPQKLPIEVPEDSEYEYVGWTLLSAAFEVGFGVQRYVVLCKP